MRTLIYKRTHPGDPGPEGQFGIHGCMGQVRTWGFEAVVGESRAVDSMHVTVRGAVLAASLILRGCLPATAACY